MSVQEVEDLLLEMKDDSAAMVDLAYSALLYDSQAIAKEVEQMEDEADHDYDSIQRLTLEAVRAGDLSVDHAVIILSVARTAETIANAALEIADVVLRDVELHPVIAATIRSSDTTVTKVTLSGGSPLAGKTLRDTEVESEYGMRIVAVKSRGKWTSAVDGSYRLLADDLLVAVGAPEAEERFLEVCQ